MLTFYVERSVLHKLSLGPQSNRAEFIEQRKSEQWHQHQSSKQTFHRENRIFTLGEFIWSCFNKLKERLEFSFKDLYPTAIWKHIFTVVTGKWTQQWHHSQSNWYNKESYFKILKEYFLHINDKLNSGCPDATCTSPTSNPEKKLHKGNNVQLTKELT